MWGSPHGLYPSDQGTPCGPPTDSPGTSPHTDYQVKEEKAQFLTRPDCTRRKMEEGCLALKQEPVSYV